ncbi:MAG TPA: PT domain-containing protein [Candidatus Nanoarchaeia archaeon]|nr:PT domain-containing protein [Candidatus Nanoarchaeia archaeon]
MKYLTNIAYATILAAATAFTGCAELPLSVRLGEHKATLDEIAKDGSVAKPAKTETGCTENEYSKLLELRKELKELASAKKDKDDQTAYDALVTRANAMVDAISANETVQAHLLIEARRNPQTKTAIYGAKQGEPLTLTGTLTQLSQYITTADDALKVAQYIASAKEMGYNSQPDPAELMENSVEVRQAKRKELVEQFVPTEGWTTQGRVLDKETILLWLDGNRENGEIENMRLVFTVGGDTKVGEKPAETALAAQPTVQPTETAPTAQPTEQPTVQPTETAPAEQPVKSPLDRLPVPGENQPLPGEHK